MSHWQSPETAPKDSTTFLADFGCLVAVVASWSKVHGVWCAATPQLGLYHDAFDDAYFDNEFFKGDALKGWMPLPEVQHEH